MKKFDSHGFYTGKINRETWRLVPCKGECRGTGIVWRLSDYEKPDWAECKDCDGKGSQKEYDLEVVSKLHGGGE